MKLNYTNVPGGIALPVSEFERVYRTEPKFGMPSVVFPPITKGTMGGISVSDIKSYHVSRVHKGQVILKRVTTT